MRDRLTEALQTASKADRAIAHDMLTDMTAAVGTGPYELQGFAIGLQTMLVRNEDDTWGSDLSEKTGPGHVQTITLREIPDPSTAFPEMQTGGIDLLLGVPTDFLPILKAEAKVRIIRMPGTGISDMPINVTARTFLISSLPEAKVAGGLNVSYDPARANELSEEAGRAMGADGVRVKDGERLAVDLFTANSTEFARLLQVEQAQLPDLGMEANITVFDSATILDRFFSGNRLGYPDVSMWSEGEGQRPNDKAMTQSATAAERIARFTACHEYILTQQLFVPIYQPTQNIAVPDPMRGSRFRQQSFMDIQVVE